MPDPILERALEEYSKDIHRDKLETNRHKDKFVKEVVGGLGVELTKFDNYKKKAPSRMKKFWRKVKKVLWNV